MNKKSASAKYISTTMRSVVGGQLSPQVLGMRQLKPKDVTEKLTPLLKGLEPKTPISIKIQSIKGGLIANLTVIPGPTIELCKFIFNKSGVEFDKTKHKFDVSTLEQAADLRIKCNCLNTNDRTKVVRSMISTFKAAGMEIIGADAYKKQEEK